jgi:hypothetical protein
MHGVKRLERLPRGENIMVCCWLVVDQLRETAVRRQLDEEGEDLEMLVWHLNKYEGYAYFFCK